MRKMFTAGVLILLISNVFAELKNANPDPGEPWIVGGINITPESHEFYNNLPVFTVSVETEDDQPNQEADNSGDIAMRPVFPQGWYANCAQASIIGYVFTYEINKARGYSSWNLVENSDGELVKEVILETTYPVNYSYNYYNEGSASNGSHSASGATVAKEQGVPNSVIWEQQTGHPLTGNARQWMTNYDNYLSTMKNRVSESFRFLDYDPSISEEENLLRDLNKIKWYSSCYGDPYVTTGGGLISFSFAFSGYDGDQIIYNSQDIYVIHTPGSTIDHAMTIVGYDDNVKWDFNNDGRFTNDEDINFDRIVDMNDWEIGAFKVVNSHGKGFGEDGYCYIPYRLFADRDAMTNFVGIEVDEDYSPEITYKIQLKHNERNELRKRIGVSVDPLSSTPEELYGYGMYNSAGGQFPMQGVNNDPIEYGFDLSDIINSLYEKTGSYRPKKFDFTVFDILSDGDAVNENEIISLSLVDYRNGNELYIQDDVFNTPIADRLPGQLTGETILSLTYDIITENIDSDSDLSLENYGLPNSLLFSPFSVINLKNDINFYLRNSSLSAAGGIYPPGTIRTAIILNSDVKFIGYEGITETVQTDEEEFIKIYESELIVNNVLEFIDCNLVLGNLSNITLADNAELILAENSKLIIDHDVQFQFGTDSRIVLKSGSELVLKESSDLIVYDHLVIEPGAKIIVEGDARIVGNFKTADLASIDIMENSTLNLGTMSDIKIFAGTTIKLQANSKLVIQNGANLAFEDGALVEASKGAEIIVWTKGYLTANGTTFSYVGDSGQWLGINAIGGSTIQMNNSNIIGAKTAISGSPFSLNISDCSFTNCEMGIFISACKNPIIKNNNFIGMDGIGTGIGLAQSTKGEISGNTIQDYFYGINMYLSSPIVINNVLKNNRNSGFTTQGMNAMPILVNTSETRNVLNNTIVDNGELFSPQPHPNQISVGIGSAIYLYNGRNNIYSHPINTVPVIPCAKIQGPINPDPPVSLYINAENNYWGATTVSDGFFKFSGQCLFYYDNSGPFNTGIIPDDDIIIAKSYKDLGKGFEAENDGKFDKAITAYEKVITKYPDSEEAMVSYTRLLGNYIQLDLDLDPLLAIYDAKLNGKSASKVNKKFFKEMKVATHLHGKKYDDAIAISEEMLLEAETEEEEILYEIDIAIANMLKNAEGKGKNKTTEDHSKTLSDLLAKLNGDEGKGEPTDITESAIPAEFTLYQNYPNPFNPTTEIRFALPIASGVKLNVYNINGQLVSELVNGSKEAGIHTVSFDGNNLNSGMYFYSLEANGISITKKMILTK